MSQVMVSSVGDMRLARPLIEPFSDALEILRRSDMCFGNLEAPFIEEGEPADKWAVLKQSPKLVGEYAKMGFRILQLANNHMLDYGQLGLVSTLRTLRDAGMQYVGAGENIGEALKPAYLEQKGFRVGFLDCASTLPGESVAGEHKSGIVPIRVRTHYHIDSEMEKEQPGNPPVILTEPNEEDVERMAKAVRAAKAEADYVIVGIHWGMAYQENIMDYQPIVGRAFIDAGADVIVGHHAHRLQGVHRYRDGFIFYSLGNFYFEMLEGTSYPKDTKWRHWPPRLGMWSQSNESVIVRTVIEREEATHELIPTFKPDAGSPELMKEADAEHLLKRVEFLSKDSDVRFSISKGRATIG
jgi:poly-gamma-glutamate synthesis protein (capsule biosynthesis protein)